MLNGEKLFFANGNFLFTPTKPSARKQFSSIKNLSSEARNQLEIDILNLILQDKNRSIPEIYSLLYTQNKLPQIAENTYLPEHVVKMEVYRLRRKHTLFRDNQAKQVVKLMLQQHNERDILHLTGIHRETARRIRRALFRPADRGALKQQFVDGIQKLANEIRQELENEKEK